MQGRWRGLHLHGNPTSSYLWRNVIPHVIAARRRAIPPDLIGMGDSGKPAIGYTFAEHARYLDALLAELDLSPATFVIHDWGSAFDMRYTRLSPARVERLAYMEAIVAPGIPFRRLRRWGLKWVSSSRPFVRRLAKRWCSATTSLSKPCSHSSMWRGR